MAGQSDIEWTDATWNPVTGCVMVSPGCTNCYAMRMAARLQAMRLPAYDGVTRKSGKRAVWTGKVILNRAALDAPLRWRVPRRIFVNSMSDLFQEGVPRSYVAEIWSVMQRARHHVFQVLTKRPERLAALLQGLATPPNVWIGTSVESEDHVDRIDILRAAPAAVRFISFEPLIGSVGSVDLSRIDWAIVGGESGPGARPIRMEWVDEIEGACRRAETSFFFKQWGGVNKKATGRLYRGRTWDEYPDTAHA